MGSEREDSSMKQARFECQSKYHQLYHHNQKFLLPLGPGRACPVNEGCNMYSCQTVLLVWDNIGRELSGGDQHIQRCIGFNICSSFVGISNPLHSCTSDQTIEAMGEPWKFGTDLAGVRTCSFSFQQVDFPTLVASLWSTVAIPFAQLCIFFLAVDGVCSGFHKAYETERG